MVAPQPPGAGPQSWAGFQTDGSARHAFRELRLPLETSGRSLRPRAALGPSVLLRLKALARPRPAPIPRPGPAPPLSRLRLAPAPALGSIPPPAGRPRAHASPASGTRPRALRLR